MDEQRGANTNQKKEKIRGVLLLKAAKFALVHSTALSSSTMNVEKRDFWKS